MVYCKISTSKAIKVASTPGTKVYNVAWHPGRRDLLACATSGGGKILDMEHRETEAVQLGTADTRRVAWSPAGDLLITLGEENLIWNSRGDRVATLLGQAGGYEAQFNVSGRLVAVSRGDGFAHVFDTSTGVLQQSVEQGASFLHTKTIVWKDELEFFSHSGVNINHWRIGQSEPLQIMNGQTWLCMAMDFNAEKGILASGGLDGIVRLWKEGATMLNGHTHAVIQVMWKPNDSGILASCSLDRQVRIWDAISKTNLHSYQGFDFRLSCGMSGFSFSPDGRFFAAAGNDHNVKVVKVSTGETVAECEGNFVSWSRGTNKIAVNIVVEWAASVYNLENVMEVKLKTLSMKRVASLLEKNLTKDEAKKFLANEIILTDLVSDVSMYIN